MRSVTYLMVAASLIFGGILLQEHYGIAGRLWHYRSGDAAQPKGAPIPSPGWNFTSADHDYQVVIDISGKGPLVSLVHPPAPEAKKAVKKSRKAVAARPSTNGTSGVPSVPTQIQSAPVAQTPAPPTPTQESGTKPQ